MGNPCPRRRSLPAAQRPQTIRSWPLLSSRAVCLLAALLAGTGCGGDDDGPMAAPTALRVIVFGDMPYVEPDTPARDSLLGRYAAVLDTIAAESVSFVVHIGDITALTCSDSRFLERRREFAALPHPVIFTPGDNEWLDCPSETYDRYERLAKLRELFAAGDRSLGGRRLSLERQSANPLYAAFRENARWTASNVMFLTVHVVGSNNGRGLGAEPHPEYVERNAANLAWLRESFAEARRADLRGVVIIMHANPIEGWPPDRPDEVNGLIETRDEIRALAAEFGRPVALVHGDTHEFRVDRPLRDAQGNMLTDLIRAETYGWPHMHAMIMTVDPAGPELFTFEPLIVRGNALH